MELQISFLCPYPTFLKPFDMVQPWLRVSLSTQTLPNTDHESQNRTIKIYTLNFQEKNLPFGNFNIYKKPDQQNCCSSIFSEKRCSKFKMNILGRIIRHSAPISSRYGGICAFSSVTPTPAKDIEKLVSSNKVVVFMKGNPEVISCATAFAFPLLILIFPLGSSLWLLKCRSSDHADARGGL